MAGLPETLIDSGFPTDKKGRVQGRKIKNPLYKGIDYRSCGAGGRE